VSEDFRGSSLLDIAWKDYHGWDAASDALQKTSRQQALWALIITCGAALFGALASIRWPDDGTILIATSLTAAIMASIGAVLGRQILDANAQQQWLQARAAAEAIKSECFRYAARSGEYAGRDAALRFTERIDALSATAMAKGLAADAQTRAAATGGPVLNMTAETYRNDRLLEQGEWYRARSHRHATAARLLRHTSFVLGCLAAALGAVSAAHIVGWVAPFVAMMTTVTASVAAYSVLSRRVYLAASYSAMASQLQRLAALHRDGVLPDDKLVEAGEDLLTSEHRVWADRMVQQEPEARQRQTARAKRARSPAGR
jgi:SMODS and SLOG-associating 2TM effector domain 1/Protein of unknown function (DUF4231)